MGTQRIFTTNLGQFNIISCEQYGFKEKSNTEEALIRVTNHNTSSFNTNKNVWLSS